MGELVAEVSDKPRAPFDSTGRDAFRRLWDEGYPDDLTDGVIAAYSKGWKPNSSFTTRSDRPRRGCIAERSEHTMHCARFRAASSTGLRRAGGPFRIDGRIDLPCAG